jgi:hypothetical protein
MLCAIIMSLYVITLYDHVRNSIFLPKVNNWPVVTSLPRVYYNSILIWIDCMFNMLIVCLELL